VIDLAKIRGEEPNVESGFNPNVEVIIERVNQEEPMETDEQHQQEHQTNEVKMAEENTEAQNPIDGQPTADNNSGENNQVEKQ
jgi:hypothetical protein